MSKSKKRGPKPYKRDSVILQLRNLSRATSAELNCQTAYLFTLLQKGIVTRAGQIAASGESKGRPQTVWKLTPQGQGKASSLKRKNSIAA
jgi:hypothetical protein